MIEVVPSSCKIVPKVIKSNKYMAKIALNPSTGHLQRLIDGFSQGRHFKVATI